MKDLELNEFLLNRGGRNLFNQPLYKLVWSTSELELRFGTFREFRDDVFIREVTETRWTRKYNYIHDRWILERWIPPALGHNKELPLSSQGTYEPIYVFEDGNRQYLAPNIKVLEFIIEMAERPRIMTEAEIISELKGKEEKEVLQIMEALEQ